MEECLEVALTVQLGVEEEMAEEVMMVAVMATMVKLMVMDNIYMSIHAVHVGCQVMESTVDGCKVVEACLIGIIGQHLHPYQRSHQYQQFLN